VEGLFPVGVIVILVALGAFANVIGADSRDREEHPHRWHPLLGDI
jgi:hypothetical protein